MILLCLVFGILAGCAVAGLSLFLGAGLLAAIGAYGLGGSVGFGLALMFGLWQRRTSKFALAPESA